MNCATPSVNPPRRLSCSLKERLQTAIAIDTNVASGVLIKFEKPTDWVHNLNKKNGSLQLCLDPQHLNQLIKRDKESGLDPEIALLEFRNTPITGLNNSPVQLLMGQRLRSSLPMIFTCLDTESSNDARGNLIKQQQRSQACFNRQSEPLNGLKTNDVVRLKHGNRWKKAVVLTKQTAPQSYILKIVDGTVLRRNRRHLRHTKEVLSDGYIDDEGSHTCEGEISQSTENSQVTSNQSHTAMPLTNISETRTRYDRII